MGSPRGMLWKSPLLKETDLRIRIKDFFRMVVSLLAAEAFAAENDSDQEEDEEEKDAEDARQEEGRHLNGMNKRPITTVSSSQREATSPTTGLLVRQS